MLLLPAAAQAEARSDAPLVEVWKKPTCGCCKDWIAHLEANGFRTLAHDTGNTAMRSRRLGIDMRYGSCHTARVAGYAIEEHVPAAEIRRPLKEMAPARRVSLTSVARWRSAAERHLHCKQLVSPRLQPLDMGLRQRLDLAARSHAVGRRPMSSPISAIDKLASHQAAKAFA